MRAWFWGSWGLLRKKQSWYTQPKMPAFCMPANSDAVSDFALFASCVELHIVLCRRCASKMLQTHPHVWESLFLLYLFSVVRVRSEDEPLASVSTTRSRLFCTPSDACHNCTRMLPFNTFSWAYSIHIVGIQTYAISVKMCKCCLLRKILRIVRKKRPGKKFRIFDQTHQGVDLVCVRSFLISPSPISPKCLLPSLGYPLRGPFTTEQLSSAASTLLLHCPAKGPHSFESIRR